MAKINKTRVVFTTVVKTVEREKINLKKPTALQLENLRWIINTSENAQEEFNIKSTPSFVINGEVLGGNKSIKVFRQIIDKSLSE